MAGGSPGIPDDGGYEQPQIDYHNEDVGKKTQENTDRQLLNMLTIQANDVNAKGISGLNKGFEALRY